MREIKLYIIDIQNNFIKEVVPVELTSGNYQLKSFTEVIDKDGNLFTIYPSHYMKEATLNDEEIGAYVKKIGGLKWRTNMIMIGTRKESNF